MEEMCFFSVFEVFGELTLFGCEVLGMPFPKASQKQ